MQPPSFALPEHRIVALSGRDAAIFAQAQFMNDVKALAAGHWQWSGWLTPKGRVIALFALLKFDEENVWLLLQDADPVEFAARLQGFVFRSKVAIAVRDDLQTGAAFKPPAQAAGSRMAIAGDNDITLDLGGADGQRSLRIATDAIATTDANALARWSAFDLAHGLPRLPAAQSGQWTPQQLSLDRLQAYSVKKGCYPGQEIVARTHFLGQAKRGLALFESNFLLTPGAAVAEGERVLGTVVSAAATAERRLALAVLARDQPVTALHVEGASLDPVALLDGLAR